MSQTPMTYTAFDRLSVVDWTITFKAGHTVEVVTDPVLRKATKLRLVGTAGSRSPYVLGRVRNEAIRLVETFLAENALA